MCNVHETTVMTTWLQLDGIQPGTFEGRIRVYSSWGDGWLQKVF